MGKTMPKPRKPETPLNETNGCPPLDSAELQTITGWLELIADAINILASEVDGLTRNDQGWGGVPGYDAARDYAMVPATREQLRAHFAERRRTCYPGKDDSRS